MSNLTNYQVMSRLSTSFPELNDLFNDEGLFPSRWRKEWSPAVNVVENEGDFEIEVVAPGMKKDEFTVAVENGILSIHGSSKREEEEKDKNYTRKEYIARSFSKSFTLPDQVDAEDVTAKYEDGVLRLYLKKNAKEIPPKKEVQIH